MKDTSIQSKLYDLLIGRNYDPELLDSAGKPITNPADGEIYSFDYTSSTGNDYGTIVIVLDDNMLDVYFGDNVGRSMEPSDKKEWFDFLYQLKMFAKRNLYSFGLKNLKNLKHSMKGMSALKEGLFESFSGTKKVSYSDKPETARLILRHNRTLGEGDARFRYIESIFIETTQGERFKLPFTKLSGAKAMLEHVRQGGRPYDIRGQHISNIVEELSILSRFNRAKQSRLLEGDALQYVNETAIYYESLKKNIKRLSNSRGYTNYFESWQPEEISEAESLIENIKNLFIEQTLDTRIESALPIMARIIQKGNNMKEVAVFENWVSTINEGTWALPETPEQQAELNKLLSQELIVGADAMNATEQLYGLVGDDELFDRLGDLAEQNPDANCWDDPAVVARLEELGISFPDNRGSTVDESKMADLDIEYQDWVQMAPRAFFQRYHITKDAWALKYKSLIKPAQTESEACNESSQGEHCPVHGLEECYGAITTATPPLAESELTRILRISGIR
jgi:hypothetical protein